MKDQVIPARGKGHLVLSIRVADGAGFSLPDVDGGEGKGAPIVSLDGAPYASTGGGERNKETSEKKTDQLH